MIDAPGGISRSPKMRPLDPNVVLPQPAQRLVVDISDCKCSVDPDLWLVTYALGSCIGVTAWDPALKIGALGHFMLPNGSIDPKKSAGNPHMFVDTGIHAMLGSLFDMGAAKERLVVKVAGGAAIMDREDRFRIGERNVTILRKYLWKNGILLDSHDTGGGGSRNVFLHVGSGRVVLKTGGGLYEL